MQSNSGEPLLPSLSFKDATAIKPLTVGQAQDIKVDYMDKVEKKGDLLDIYYQRLEYLLPQEPGLQELIDKLNGANAGENIHELLSLFFTLKEANSTSMSRSVEWRWIRTCLNETLNFEAQQFGQHADKSGSTMSKSLDTSVLKKIHDTDEYHHGRYCNEDKYKVKFHLKEHYSATDDIGDAAYLSHQVGVREGIKVNKFIKEQMLFKPVSNKPPPYKPPKLPTRRN
jgi:hypothetical protein